MLFVYDGIEIDYIDKGTGYPLVFIHGWGGDKISLAPIYNHLTRYRIISISCPYPEDRVWTVNKYADLIAKLLEYLGIRRYTIVGHSFGGRLCIELGAHADSVVLIDSAGIRPRFSLHKWLMVRWYKLIRLLVKCRLIRPSILKRFGSDDYRVLSHNMKKTFVSIVNYDQTRLLIHMPKTLIIWGKDDKDTPMYMAKKMHKMIPDNRLIVYNGGHFMYLDNSQDIAILIENFLN